MRFKDTVTNEDFSFVRYINDEAAVSETLFAQSSSSLQKTLETLCSSLGIAEHALKATSLAKLSHFIGEETKFQRLRGGSGVAEAPQQYLKLPLASLPPPTLGISHRGCSDSEKMQGIIRKG